MKTLTYTQPQIGYVSVATERGEILSPVHIYVAQFVASILLSQFLQIAIIFSAQFLFAADSVIDIMALWLYRMIVIGAILVPVLVFALTPRVR